MMLRWLVDGRAEVWLPLLKGGVVQRNEAPAVEQLPVNIAFPPLQMVMLLAMMLGVAGLGFTVRVKTADESLVHPLAVAATR